MFETHGSIDIAPPLLWSEVKAAGFMVANNNGVPKIPAGQWVGLTAVDQVIDRPEGSLHKYTFAELVPAATEIPVDQREVLRAQVAAIVAAFPASVFGGVSRVILFRGNELEDIWRIRVAPDRTVQRQVADLTWNAAPVAAPRTVVAFGTHETGRLRPPPPGVHCGELADHAPHEDRGEWCPGGPYAAPGNTKLTGG